MKSRTRRAAAFAFAAAGALGTAPTAGAVGLDPTFGTGGSLLTPLSVTAGDRFYAATPGPAGSAYAVGFTSFGGTDQVFALTRLGSDGSPDRSFGNEGTATVNVSAAPFAAGPAAPNGGPQAGPSGTSETARAVAVQSDGKIVVAGQAETPSGAGKPDSRDLDIFVARFQPNGSLDTSYGTAGVARIDLSDGVQAVTDPAAATLAPNGDQAYGILIRPDDRVLVTGAKGTDSSDNATRPDRDLAIVQLSTSGRLDTSFGTGGVSVGRLAGINENPRNGLLQADGKVVLAGYGGTPTKPILFRVGADGTPDASFGTGGVATALGAAASRAEAYGLVQQGDKYVLSGYGSRLETASDTDAILYRFNGDGTWDESFGPAAAKGFVTYDGGVGGGADRFRNLAALPDGRIVGIGGTTNVLSPASTDGLIAVFDAGGALDPSVGTGGITTVDFGGPGDFFYGVAVSGLEITVTGYKGGATGAADDAGAARLDLTPPASPVPPAPLPQGPPTVPGTPTTPAPVVPIGPAAKSKSAGKVTISCSRTGRTKARVTCRVSQSRVAAGTVRIKLSRKGVKAANGKAKASKGKATVTIVAKRPAAKYTVTVILPTPAGTTQTIKRTVTVK